MVFILTKIGTLKVGSIIHIHITVLCHRPTDIPHQANHTFGVLKQTSFCIGFTSHFDPERTDRESQKA
jgi:hypothetical protein